MSRLMDRPLRPAMHPGWFHETQLLSWVLSYDTVHPPVPLAITAASAALALSNVPLMRAIAGVTVSSNRSCAEQRYCCNDSSSIHERPGVDFLFYFLFLQTK